MKIPSLLFAGCLAALLASPAFGQTGHAHHGATAASATAPAMTQGVVKKVDRARGEVTIAHDEIKNLDMPRMTMAFRLKDASWIGKFKDGDKIRFAADMVNKELTIIGWEPAK